MPRAAEPSEEDKGAEEEDDQDIEVEVAIMEERAQFEEVVVWGHEVLPDGMADPYVRVMEEWIACAEQVC